MDAHETYINMLSERIHADCKKVGWWDDPDRCLHTCLQLISTEISEATEGARKDLMDDHLEGFKMEEVEYADALIRLLDFGGRMLLQYDSELAIINSYCTVYNSVGKQHMGLTKCVVKLCNALDDFIYKPTATTRKLLETQYSDLIKNIIQVAMNRGYSDFYEAVEGKMEYNKHRADHKRENRAKENGKKW